MPSTQPVGKAAPRNLSERRFAAHRMNFDSDHEPEHRYSSDKHRDVMRLVDNTNPSIALLVALVVAGSASTAAVPDISAITYDCLDHPPPALRSDQFSQLSQKHLSQSDVASLQLSVVCPGNEYPANLKITFADGNVVSVPTVAR